MVSYFREQIDYFVSLGLTDVIFPFIIVFALMYAFLLKSKVLNNRKLDAMVAFAVAFTFIAFAPKVSVLNSFLETFAIFSFIIFSLLFLAYPLLGDVKLKKTNLFWAWAFLVFGLIITYLVDKNDVVPGLFNRVVGNEIFVIIIICSLVLSYIFRGGKEEVVEKSSTDAKIEKEKNSKSEQTQEPEEKKSNRKKNQQSEPKLTPEQQDEITKKFGPGVMKKIYSRQR